VADALLFAFRNSTVTRERLPSHDGFIIVGIGFGVEEEGGGTPETEVVIESGVV
jgi:hypothetical protein